MKVQTFLQVSHVACGRCIATDQTLLYRDAHVYSSYNAICRSLGARLRPMMCSDWPPVESPWVRQQSGGSEILLDRSIFLSTQSRIVRSCHHVSPHMVQYYRSQMR